MRDYHEYPRVPRMNDDQLAAAQGFFRDHAGDSCAIGTTFGSAVKVSVFKDNSLIAAARISSAGVIVDDLLSEVA